MRSVAKDEADIASEQEEYARQEALRRFQAKPRLTAGICNNCFEPAFNAFCDAGCRRDWEREQEARKRNGGQARKEGIQ